ncbi:non-homologous end-joining DNA ligase [Paenibacillus sp. UNC499MF]|uniref:non-homologous end-joining DNA ligase n=1 Tax=Paenibacillus sp. UNC499MF TaxID=1502751 RepID=UPI0008A05BD9|nr:non-homologous end-joining DNA ligase [Paenibacillus sp. UNC499MF]SEG43270.1 bifunctional non-homologous end joining protein LigD [Paenibacillus sp. UNC499MF]
MSPSSTESGVVTVDGNEITVSNPQKLLWPEAGITKVIYLQKLIALSPYLLPYCRDRYLTTIRYPDGVGGKFFYQKNAPSKLPEFVKTAAHGGVNYIHLNSLSTLLWLGNLAALEFHPSFEYIGGEKPAEWVLDIDPSFEDEPRLMEAVAIIGETLEGMGVRSVPKTSGATGVQIFVPIRDGYTFDQLRSVGEFLGNYLAEKHPRLFTVERLIKERGKKIYIDYVQHAPGKSLSAPYTPRGREEATVSTPLTWDEVRQGVSPKLFTLLTIEQRLDKMGDLIAAEEKQSLDPVLDFIR